MIYLRHGVTESADIIAALTRLGQLATEESCTVRLAPMGGAALVLGYNARQSTQDVDVLFLPPPQVEVIRAWSARIARENDWPKDWLNDAAKAYLTTVSEGSVLFEAPGIIADATASWKRLENR
jgi:hypothetical protein